MEKRKRIIEVLHDKHSVHSGRFRAIGDFAIVWVNKLEITEQLTEGGEWVPVVENKKPVEKLLRFWRVDVPVGESFMGIPVTQVDPAWVEREKEILKARDERD